jgi:cytochrome c oxidase subunit 2
VNGSRSVLDPAGPAARVLAELGWPMLVGFTVTAAVMWGLLAWVAVRKKGTFDTHAPLETGGGMAWVVLGGFVIPGIAFTASFVATIGVMRGFPLQHEQAVVPEIRVLGHQWWWQVEYRGARLTDRFETANEIHIPVGRPIDIELATADVIHSFWVPRLHGKVDLVPTLKNTIRIEAAQPGVYPGSCAEFCGLQHAGMRFEVIAEMPDDYERWLERQQRPAVAITDPQAARGESIFMRSACPICHAVAGTSALATVGPDLTHLGSRSTIGAGWVPKDVATLHAWVMNAPSLKPGTRMPALTQFTGPELHDLVAYLEALQ